MSKRLQIARAQGNSINSNGDGNKTPLKGEPVYDEKNDLFYIGDGTNTIADLTPYRKTNIYNGTMETGRTYAELTINQPVKINYDEPIEIITYFKNDYPGETMALITNKIWDSTSGDYEYEGIAADIPICDMHNLPLPENGYKENTVNSLYLLKTKVNNTDTYKLFINSPIARWG